MRCRPGVQPTRWRHLLTDMCDWLHAVCSLFRRWLLPEWYGLWLYGMLQCLAVNERRCRYNNPRRLSNDDNFDFCVHTNRRFV